MNKKYEEIINLKYEGVKSHKKMDRSKRASIFSPFAPIKINDNNVKDINDDKGDKKV